MEPFMKTGRTQKEQVARLPITLETGIDEAVEFQIPEPASRVCFFSLGRHSDLGDLVLVVNDFVVGQIEYRIDFDDVVENLLGAFANERPTTLQGNLDDVAMLRALAKRFQSVAARLTEAARKREARFGIRTRLAR